VVPFSRVNLNFVPGLEQEDSDLSRSMTELGANRVEKEYHLNQNSRVQSLLNS